MSDVDVIAAVRDRLAEYLAAELPALAPVDTSGEAVVVRAEWPGPREVLPKRCITVIAPEGVALDVRHWPPVDREVTEDAPGSLTGTVTMTSGRFRADLRLDAWATSADARKALVAALDRLLHRHPQVTLPGGDGLPRPGRWPELALRCDALGTDVFYRFKEAQAPAEDGGMAQSAEHRTTLVGTAEGVLTSTEPCAMLRRIDALISMGVETPAPTETFTTPED